MTQSIQTSGPLVSPFVSVVANESLWTYRAGAAAVPASATFPAVNRAYYFPFVTYQPCTIRRFWWLNGTVAGTDNVQVGVYNDAAAGPGTAVLRGTSTTASGVSVMQFDDVTDTALPAGMYWLALWCSGTTTTITRYNPSAVHARAFEGYLESSLSGGLPATATPATANAATWVGIFGFSTIASP